MVLTGENPVVGHVGSIGKIIKDNIGLHFNQTKGGPTITVSSYFAAISDLIKSMEDKTE